ncbi:C25 family cysteine peptidase [Pontibacter sp. SGAir0037]|uniref:putative type IX secretion system sortase PorU2 n=1 Tax=Pontibacter sp. SGAir0037 TaxID=2571030 RepID=UPI0010CCDBC6|nr:C25 family cysteine peptidase [Pontibacter sp. SGAir0037]QCR22934.1 hypothetical protein C1N53_11655 [Pontibacter sp. SGAir0037]
MSQYRFFRHFIFVVTLLLAFGTLGKVQAQSTYGNEWINHSQTYYKIRVFSDGLHRLNYTYLDSLGLKGVDPRHFQIFRKGKQLAIYVAGEEDGKLDQQDFIEFFGEKNNGALDKEMYKDPKHQIHQLRSIYTDTAAYFLTFSAAGGKRMRVANTVSAGRTAEPYHIQKAATVFFDAFYRGKKYEENMMPWLDLGQGYVGSTSRNPKSWNLDNIINLETTGFKPQLAISVYTRNNIIHNASVNLLPATGGSRLLSRYTFDGFGFEVSKFPVEFSEISSAGRLVVQTVPDYYAPSTENQFSLAHGIVTFPQKSIVTGNHMQFYTDSARTLNPYYEFTGATAATVAYDITDEGNITRIAGVAVGSKFGYAIAAEDGKSHRVLLANTSRAIRPKVARTSPVKFRTIQPEAFNYIVLTNKILMQAAGESTLPAPKEYAAYRASEAGGSYDTLLVFVDDLVNQFHYGDFSSNAISRFLKFMSSTPRAKQMLILGKGVEFDRINYRNTASRALDLVPTAGIPGSDVMFSADFRNNSFVPAVPTGRLSVTTPLEIVQYLNKVKEYEAVPLGEKWQKNILHLGGGKKTEEINLLASYLSAYEGIAQGPYFGANIIRKTRKNISEVVENINVSDEINKGVSLVTFFGHSAPGATDLDIGLASNAINGYSNKGKYPIMLMNGCSAGNIFVPSSVSFGEDWVKTPDRGAISFIAHVEAGYPNFLNMYSQHLYNLAFQDVNFYGKPIGLIQQEVIRRVKASASSDLATAMVMEMVLQGDPAVRFASPAKPDYLVQENSMDVAPVDDTAVTATSAEFYVTLTGVNYGKAITDSVRVSVVRTLADNTVLAPQVIKVKPIIYETALQLKLSNTGIEALGMNFFEITLDDDNSIAELNEGNNTGRFQHYFPASGLTALSPSAYSIVGSKDVKLIVQATAARSDRQGVYFELDTTQHFNSSLKRTHIVENALLPTWELSLPAVGSDRDSTVYYWRARFQYYEAGEDTLWASNSFRYIPGASNGWSQSHYGQFDKATTADISNEGKQNLNWQFSPLVSNIEIRTVGGNIRYSTPAYGLVVDGKPVIEYWCSDPAASATPRMYMVVIEPKTLKMVENLIPAYACSLEPHLYEFGDLNNAGNRAKIETFLKAVPAGYYVAAISINSVPFASFTTSQKDAFKAIGAAMIDNLKNGYPYAIVGKKGAAAGTADELSALELETSNALTKAILLKSTIRSRKQAGTLTSTLIGPAESWGTLHHHVERTSLDDKYKLSLLGITPAGQQVVLQPEITGKTFDLSGIDAKVYPSIQLSVALSDSADRTSPQLKQWLVYYNAAPEGVIRPDLVEVSEQILTDQANKKGLITLPMAFQNITSFAFKDSILVEVTLTGDGIQRTVASFKIAPLDAYKTANFSYSLSTLNLSGSYKLSMFVNPRAQAEQQYFNNVYEVPFKVKALLHPILDVAFDGLHIMDGDLVSPSPLVSITVKDEHKETFLQDPAGMSVILINPEGQEQEVNLMSNDQEVRYFPADEKNDFRVEYKPAKLADGKYSLVVRAKDVAGKASGISPYQIGFEVENQASVTNFYPFPNPFSTKTQFIFTLTGSTVPDNLKIQILTVTGKVVKEIEKEELGPIRIGNNKTEYAWDGTDTYGDKLANGVYLYRVVMSKLDGEEEMKHRNSYGDKAFKNGYGKLYILR